MPRGERFYFRHAVSVVDGTRCSDENFDVCVNGTCQVSFHLCFQALFQECWIISQNIRKTHEIKNLKSIALVYRNLRDLATPYVRYSVSILKIDFN